MNKKLSLEEIFSKIFKNNLWGSSETVSGFGSEIDRTKFIRKEIEKLIIEKDISSILDIPCGDFNWMRKVDSQGVKYTGADIVKELILSNQKNIKVKRTVALKS